MGPAADSRRLSDVEHLASLRRRIGQRIGWAFIALVVVIAVLGGFERGPLAHTVSDEDTRSLR